MLDWTTLSEFSRANCISICAFLVPANVVSTSVTILLAILCRPQVEVWQAAGVSSIFAVVIILHVLTWFWVGVVMVPTYILLWLGTNCLISSLGAVVLHKRYQKRLQDITGCDRV